MHREDLANISGFTLPTFTPVAFWQRLVLVKSLSSEDSQVAR